MLKVVFFSTLLHYAPFVVSNRMMRMNFYLISVRYKLRLLLVFLNPYIIPGVPSPARIPCSRAA